jgi:hypothetical protein
MRCQSSILSSLLDLPKGWQKWAVSSAPVVIGVVYYFWLLGRNPAALTECLFGPSCSLTIATWGLVCLAASAFLATALAVDYARRAYDIEVACRLEQRRCRDKEHWASPDLRVFVLPNGQIVQYGVPLEFLGRRTAGSWRRQHHAFINLGRSALVDVSVELVFTYGNRHTSRERLSLGCVGADNNEVHVTLYWFGALGRVDVRWATARHGGTEPLEFYPAQRTVSEKSF